MTTANITKKIRWKDLTQLTPLEMFVENTITLPWLIFSLTLAHCHYYILAIPCSILFFLTSLRQVHNGFHNSLGTGRKLTWLCLYLNSFLMLISVHAVKFSHLRHHKYCLSQEDHEGKCARMSWYRAICYGPMHIYSIHKAALTMGNKKYQRDVIIEIISVIAFLIFIFLVHINFLIYHCLVMIIGEMFSAFFAVWTVHHDLDEGTIARTQRSHWKNFITYNMFYHLEHHLFPAVPTIKLPELAKRIDDFFPELDKKSTF